jgi:hypothetical protein
MGTLGCGATNGAPPLAAAAAVPGRARDLGGALDILLVLLVFVGVSITTTRRKP